MEHNKSINRQSELRLSQEALLKLQENCRHIQKVLLKITIETSEYPLVILLRLPVTFYRRCNSPLNSTGCLKSLQVLSFSNKYCCIEWFF